MIPFAEKLTGLGIKPMGSDTFEPFSEQEIGKVEEAIGTALPANYKKYLSTFGRALLGTDVKCTSSDNLLLFGWFFGFTELLDAIDDLEDNLPETIIPIGEDGGGNMFCLGVAGEDAGKMYFHDHNIGWHADAESYLEKNEPVPSDIRYQTVEEIATSFEEFINNMQKEGDDN